MDEIKPHQPGEESDEDSRLEDDGEETDVVIDPIRETACLRSRYHRRWHSRDRNCRRKQPSRARCTVTGSKRYAYLGKSCYERQQNNCFQSRRLRKRRAFGICQDTPKRCRPEGF